MKDIDLRFKLIAFFTPLLSSIAFAGIYVLTDYLNGKSINWSDPAFFFNTAVIATSGALFSGGLAAARYLISSAQFARDSYLQIPWKSSASTADAQLTKVAIVRTLASFFEHSHEKIDEPYSENLALQMVQFQLRDQLESLSDLGRIQFFSSTPRNLALTKNALAESALRPDGYGLVVTAAQRGDHVEATDFQNSKYWWLNKHIAFQFFEMNLGLLRNGVHIERVFGRNHPNWVEDETGLKEDMIKLQARLKNLTVATIDYADVLPGNRFSCRPIDQFALIRDSKSLPSIEWELDERGDTSRVFYVFGEGRLRELRENFLALKLSEERGSSFVRVVPDGNQMIDVAGDDGYREAMRLFAEVIDRSSSA